MPVDLRHLKRVSWRAALVWRRNLLACRSAWLTRLLPRLLEPLPYLLALGVGVAALVGEVSDEGSRLSYLEFVAPGVLAGVVMIRSLHDTFRGAFERLLEGATFEAALTTPLSLEDVVAGEILWGTAGSLLVAGVTLGAMSLLGVARWPSSWWALPVAVLGGFLFASMGMCLAAVCPRAAAFGVPRVLLALPLLLFSGTLFPADSLPAWASRAVQASPLTHLASLLRAATLERTPANLLASLGFLDGLAAVLFVVALVLVRRRLAR